MAHLHFRRTTYKSGGRQATGRVRYITRQPMREVSPAVQQLRYIAEGREDCLFTTSKNLPAWAENNPHVFFQAAETYERANGIAFEEWKIALPQELSHGQNMGLTRDLVEAIAGDRLPITYAFHCPQTLDAHHEQPHLHLLISARQNDGIPRSPAQHFTRYNRDHPARGGAQKDDAFWHIKAVKQWRMTISDVLNVHLERAGCPERVHPDTLERRGIDRQPEPKLLPSESRAYREQGKVSDRMQAVRTIRAQRQQTRAQEQADARAYWHERKVTLRMTSAMDGTACLTAICDARAHARTHAPARHVAAGMAGVDRDERLLGDLAGDAYAQAQQAAQGVWRDVHVEHTLRDIGWGVVQAAQDEAHDAWRASQREQELRDVGWEAVRRAWDDGQHALAAARREPHAQEQVRGGQSLEQDLRALARQLEALRADDGGTGHVRLRLWDRDQGRGL